MASAPEYSAFVSYRRAEPDRSWARWVVETLERWRTPGRLVREQGLPRRLARAFQDEQELSAGPGLKDEILRRLEASRFLVVICSPEARGRPWIEEEVREFQRRGRGERVLPLLVAGEPGEALPEALLERGAPADGREPIAADVRPVAGESLRERRRRAALQLLAPILGVDLDTLRRRDDQRRHRRWAALSAALGLVALALAGLAAWALHANAQATERLVALHQEQGRTLWLGGSPSRALVHLAEAYRRGGREPALRFLLARTSRASERASFVLEGQAAMHAATYSPDGTLLATASDDGRLRLWSTRDGGLVRQLAGSVPLCRAIAFSPDGSQVLASGADLAVHVFRRSDGALEREIRPPGRPAVPDGKAYWLWRATFVPRTRRFVAVGCCGTRLLVDLEDGSARQLPEPPGPDDAANDAPEHYEWACAVSADGSRIATADSAGWLRVYDGEGLPVGEARRAHEAPARAVAFAPTGTRIYSTSDDGTTACWSAEGGDALWRTAPRPDDGMATTLAVSSHGTVAMGMDQGIVVLTDGADGRPLRRLDLHGSTVTSLAFDRGGERLLTSSGDGRALLVSVGTGRVLAAFEGHLRGVNSAELSPAGDQVATAGTDGTARLWPVLRTESSGRAVVHPTALATGTCLDEPGFPLLLTTPDGRRHLAFPRGEVARADAAPAGTPLTAVAADATRAVAVDANGTIFGWSQQRPQDPPDAVVLGRAQVNDVALLPGGRVATAGVDGLLRIHSLSGTAAPQEWPASSELRCLGASRDSRRILCGGQDGSVWLWDEGRQSLRRLHHLHRSHVKEVALSHDGRLALSAGWDGKGVLWDVEAGRLVAELRGHEGEVYDCAMSPDGARAATAGLDGSVCLWSTLTGRVERRLSGRDGHRSYARVVFSPDARLLVSYGTDGLLRVWSAASGLLLTVLEGHGHRLTQAVFCGDGAGLLSADSEGGVWWWDLSYETRSPEELMAFVATDVPWALDDEGRLVPRRR